jgi:phage terminase small subunit
MKLTPKQQLFVQEYLIDLNATQASIRAGYSAKNADKIGPELIGNSRVKAAIDIALAKRAEKMEITADRVLQEIDRLAFFDAGEITKYQVKQPADIAKLPEDIRRAITGWKWDRMGNFILTFADKKGALELRGRHMKLFSDKVELTGKDGGPLEFTELSETDRTARLATLLAKANARKGG